MTKPLTPSGLYGLMRPVARIAQSVEQGIENPRVLGSIPSPGTTYLEKPAYGLVFCFWRAGLFIELRSIHSSHPCDSPCGQRGALCKNAPGVFVRSGHHLFREPAHKAVFAFGEPDSPSNCVRFTRRRRLCLNAPLPFPAALNHFHRYTCSILIHGLTACRLSS